jgi:hypothetical protein
MRATDLQYKHLSQVQFTRVACFAADIECVERRKGGHSCQKKRILTRPTDEPCVFEDGRSIRPGGEEFDGIDLGGANIDRMVHDIAQG